MIGIVPNATSCVLVLKLSVESVARNVTGSPILHARAAVKEESLVTGTAVIVGRSTLLAGNPAFPARKNEPVQWVAPRVPARRLVRAIGTVQDAETLSLDRNPNVSSADRSVEALRTVQ